jgi:hypothetical protein
MIIKNRFAKKILHALVFIFLLSGCSFVRVQNVSDTNVRVLVNVPDSNAGISRNVRPGSVVDAFSSHGGRYSVTILPNERYREFLLDLRTEIGRRLFEERAELTGDEVGRLVARLNEVNVFLKELAEPGASCSGSLPDFDTSVVIIVFDISLAKYVLSCS